MSDTIWKFELKTIDEQYIEVPEGAEMLNVQVQNGVPCLWVRIDPAAERFKRCIVTHGTGHRMPSTIDEQYIGTYQLQGGAIVLHVFEGLVG